MCPVCTRTAICTIRATQLHLHFCNQLANGELCQYKDKVIKRFTAVGSAQISCNDLH